jgi:hypothetical protein
MRVKKTWQKFTVMNVGIVVGLFVSLFVIPATTSIDLLVVICGVFIATMNYLLFARLRKVAGGEEIRDTRLSTIVIVVGFVIFVLDVVLRLAHYSH